MSSVVPGFGPTQHRPGRPSPPAAEVPEEPEEGEEALLGVAVKVPPGSRGLLPQLSAAVAGKYLDDPVALYPALFPVAPKPRDPFVVSGGRRPRGEGLARNPATRDTGV